MILSSHSAKGYVDYSPVAPLFLLESVLVYILVPETDISVPENVLLPGVVRVVIGVVVKIVVGVDFAVDAAVVFVVGGVVVDVVVGDVVDVVVGVVAAVVEAVVIFAPVVK